MPTLLYDFSRFWRTQHESFVEGFLADVSVHEGAAYAATSRDQVRANCIAIMEAIHIAMDEGNTEALAACGYALGLRRAMSHVPIQEIMTVLDIFRAHLWASIYQYAVDTTVSLEQIEAIEREIHRFRTSIVSGYGETLRQAKADLAQREQIVLTQQNMIQSISAPIIPVYDGVLVLPLVGTIDARRADGIMEAVLEQIVQRQGDVLIMDMTGVPIVDSDVANHLLRMVQAVQLLGAQVIVVGIGAEMAQTIVGLDLDLQQVVLLANLQAAISYALQSKGFAITQQK